MMPHPQLYTLITTSNVNCGHETFGALVRRTSFPCKQLERNNFEILLFLFMPLAVKAASLIVHAVHAVRMPGDVQEKPRLCVAAYLHSLF